MPYVPFISAPGCLAAGAGLVTQLRPCHDDHVAPFRSLRHGQAPNARPPAPKLPQPRVGLIHVAPPTAIRGCCICNSELERAALEVSQPVWYGGSSVAFQEQGKEWGPAKHQITGADVQDLSRGLLIQLDGGMIHGPSGLQLELLKPLCHWGHTPRYCPVLRTQHTLEKQLRAFVMRPRRTC